MHPRGTCAPTCTMELTSEVSHVPSPLQWGLSLPSLPERRVNPGETKCLALCPQLSGTGLLTLNPG
jgi:hypothetical protein